MAKALKRSSSGKGRGVARSLGAVWSPWQFQTAKARFSELFRLARTEPQLITRRGKEAVVMLPLEQFEQLVTRSNQPRSLVEFFRESPLAGLKLDFEREKDTGREVGL